MAGSANAHNSGDMPFSIRESFNRFLDSVEGCIEADDEPPPRIIEERILETKIPENKIEQFIEASYSAELSYFPARLEYDYAVPPEEPKKENLLMMGDIEEVMTFHPFRFYKRFAEMMDIIAYSVEPDSDRFAAKLKKMKILMDIDEE